jgi:hypothetical protein
LKMAMENSNDVDSKSKSKVETETTYDGFILDDFENTFEPFTKDAKSSNSSSGVHSAANVKDGQVVGPSHVLVYDTSLRGKDTKM